MTIRAMTPAVMLLCLLFGHERRGAPDLDDLHALPASIDLVRRRRRARSRARPRCCTQPTPSSLAIRSSTSASAPDQRGGARAELRRHAAVRAGERAAGRRAAGRRRRAKTASETRQPPPAALRTAATSAPTANGARKKPSVAISPTPRITATISQITQSSIVHRRYRGGQSCHKTGAVYVSMSPAA